jgi:uncharacterized protein YegJ (DUF2314 family)
MGRYYDGDIEGKFWFGCQSSQDGEFFGAIEYDRDFIEYHIPHEKIKNVIEGIWKCKKALGDDIYLSGDSYYGTMEANAVWSNMTEAEKSYTSTWLARLDLGSKMLGFMLENPGEVCNFTAEL